MKQRLIQGNTKVGKVGGVNDQRTSSNEATPKTRLDARTRALRTVEAYTPLPETIFPAHSSETRRIFIVLYVH